MMSRMASHGDKSAPSRPIVCLIFFSGFTPRATDAGPIRGEAERLSESFYVVDSKVSATRATARHIKAKKRRAEMPVACYLKTKLLTHQS